MPGITIYHAQHELPARDVRAAKNAVGTLPDFLGTLPFVDDFAVADLPTTHRPIVDDCLRTVGHAEADFLGKLNGVHSKAPISGTSYVTPSASPAAVSNLKRNRQARASAGKPPLECRIPNTDEAGY